MTRSFIFLGLFSFLTQSVTLDAFAEVDAKLSKAPQECSYTREYITALEYIRHHSEFKIPEKAARNLAQQISSGCTGAAQRFIKINSTLAAAGIGADTALHTASEFAHRTDQEAATFVAVFLKSYLQDDLDLTMYDALNIAQSLTTEFQGDINAVRKDFETLVRFCVSEKDMNLPRPQCAQLATRITQLGEKFEGGVAQAFIQGYQFLTSSKGPALNRIEALQVAEKIIQNGRQSDQNFAQAYSYAIAKKGLGMSIQEATQFAMQMVAPPLTRSESKR